MKPKGFTLIEVIVAVFLVTVGIGGVYALIQRTTAFTPVISARLTAAYLAQEGIELVRNKRDSNWLARDPWDSNLPFGTESGLLDKFERTITLTPSGNALEVSVKVKWSERDRTHTVPALTKLYDWR